MQVGQRSVRTESRAHDQPFSAKTAEVALSGTVRNGNSNFAGVLSGRQKAGNVEQDFRIFLYGGTFLAEGLAEGKAAILRGGQAQLQIFLNLPEVGCRETPADLSLANLAVGIPQDKIRFWGLVRVHAVGALWILLHARRVLLAQEQTIV